MKFLHHSRTILFIGIIFAVCDVLIFSINYLLNALRQNYSPNISPGYFEPYHLQPEPYEIPVYVVSILVLTVFLPLSSKLIPFYKRNHSTLESKKSKIIISIFTIILGILFFSQIGTYPAQDSFDMIKEYESFKSLERKTYTIAIAIIILILACSPLFILRSQTISKGINKFFPIFMFVFLMAITFYPNFPVSLNDYAYFIGPIHEISMGKTIYTHVASQYGFLSVVIPGLLTKPHLLTIDMLPIIVWLLYVIEYFLLYKIIRNISKSNSLSILFVTSALIISYFSRPLNPFAEPQTGAIRFAPFIFAIYYLFKFKKIFSKRFILLIGLFSLFLIDSGIALVLTYLFSLFALYLSGEIDLSKFFNSAVFLLCSIIFCLLGIQILLLLLGYDLINPYFAFDKLVQYSSDGFYMLPLPNHSYLWVILAINVFVLFYIFLKRKTSYPYNVLVFAVYATFFASIYYIGRSHPQNLITLASLPIFCLYLIISLLLKILKSKMMIMSVYALLFIFTIILPLVNKPVEIKNRFIEKFQPEIKSNFFLPTMKRNVLGEYGREIQLINSSIPDKSIIIIASDDTFILWGTNKSNLLNHANPQSYLINKSEIKKITNEVKICPKKIVVESSIYNNKSDQPITFTHIKKSLPLLYEEYKKSCPGEYNSAICEESICIVEK